MEFIFIHLAKNSFGGERMVEIGGDWWRLMEID